MLVIRLWETGYISMKRYLPIIILFAVGGIIYAMGWHNLLTFESLKANREILQAYVQNQFFLSVLLFIGLYVLVVTLSLPGAAILSISAGFLFGTALGTVLAVTSATIGACVIFMIAQSAFGENLTAKAGPWVDKMRKGFQKNAFSYLLSLRLVPLFPFFIVNLVPAILGMKLRSFALATGIGIIPGGFVYVSVGTGLGSIFDSGETFSISSILTPEILIALTGLGLLSLFPTLMKQFRPEK